jgi:hypothetical protein
MRLLCVSHLGSEKGLFCYKVLMLRMLIFGLIAQTGQVKEHLSIKVHICTLNVL